MSASVSVDRDALAREPAVVEPSRPQRRLHRLVEGRVVVGGDRVERDAHRAVALTTAWSAKARVEVRRIEAGDPVPERDVRRGRLLRLQRDDPADRLDDIERLAPQQQLAGEGGAVELTGGEAHPGSVAGGGREVVTGIVEAHAMVERLQALDGSPRRPTSARRPPRSAHSG